MTLTTTEAAVLGLLRSGELSGYDLRREVERSVGYFWAPAKTQIYTVLPRLVDRGLATRRPVVQRDRPDKRVYGITDAGRAALSDWIEHAPLDAGQGRNLLLLKLSLADRRHAAALLEQVRSRRADAEQLHAELVELDTAAGGRGPPFEHFTRRFGFLYADALLRWTEDVIAELERASASQRRASGAARSP